MKGVSTPVAILLGMTIIGVCLGLGVYFGLRERAPVTSAIAVRAGDESATTANGSNDTRPTSGTVAARPGPTPIDRNAATALVTSELEEQRAALVAKCWQPSFAKKATPAMTKLVVNVTFDPSGRETARGISEDAATARPDVTFCVQMSTSALHIDAPGVNVHLRVPLTLP